MTNHDIEQALLAVQGKSIVLVGLMGAGKTSVGRRLAEKLGFKFVDADQEIEEAAGQTIPEIFAQHGEDYFREGEKRVIARLLEKGQQVLATGGGAFMNDETRTAIKKNAVSIWLKADLDLLVKRVQKRDNRPLLKGQDAKIVLGNLIDIRHPVYAEADITVESRDAQHSETVAEVLQSICQWGSSANGQTT